MTDLRDYQAHAVEQIEKATKALYVLRAARTWLRGL